MPVEARVIRPSRCFHVASLGRRRQSGWQIKGSPPRRACDARLLIPRTLSRAPDGGPQGSRGGGRAAAGRRTRAVRSLVRPAAGIKDCVGQPAWARCRMAAHPFQYRTRQGAAWPLPKRDPNCSDPSTGRPSGPGLRGVERPRSPQGRRGRPNPAVRDGCRCGLWIAGRWPTFIRDIRGQAAASNRLRA